MSNNSTFSFISSSIIVIAFVSLYLVWSCFFILCGLEKQVSKYQESLAEQHLLSYCSIINTRRVTLSSRDLLPGITPNCLLCSDLDLYCDLSL